MPHIPYCRFSRSLSLLSTTYSKQTMAKSGTNAATASANNAPISNNTNTVTSTPRTAAAGSANSNTSPPPHLLPLSRLNTPTPSLDGSGHSSSDSKSSTTRKPLLNRGSSALGLDKMIDEKRDAKTMSERVVHIEV